MLEKENLEAKVEVLGNLSSKAVLPGTVYDCIVFHDGHSWRYVRYCMYTFVILGLA